MARKNMFINDATGKRGRYDGQFAAPVPYYPGATAAAPATGFSGWITGNRADNPPCNTLFIGGLGEGVRCASLAHALAAFIWING